MTPGLPWSEIHAARRDAERRFGSLFRLPVRARIHREIASCLATGALMSEQRGRWLKPALQLLGGMAVVTVLLQEWPALRRPSGAVTIGDRLEEAGGAMLQAGDVVLEAGGVTRGRRVWPALATRRGWISVG